MRECICNSYCTSFSLSAPATEKTSVEVVWKYICEKIQACSLLSPHVKQSENTELLETCAAVCRLNLRWLDPAHKPLNSSQHVKTQINACICACERAGLHKYNHMPEDCAGFHLICFLSTPRMFVSSCFSESAALLRASVDE